MIVPLKQSSIRYEARPAKLGGWVICEGENPIAYSDSEAYARAICNALNLHRAMVSGKLLYVRPPAGHFLN